MKITKQQGQLLLLLQEDASLSHEVLADKLGKSRQAVGRDLKELEQAGIIKRHTVDVDAQKVGLTMTVYVLVLLETHGKGQLELFESTVRERFPHVIELAHVQGGWDLLLKFVVRDNAHFATVKQLLTNTPNVSRTLSFGSIGAPRQFPMPLAHDQ